jgi:hypothetical protein
MQTFAGLLIYVSVLATGVTTDTNRTFFGHATLTRDILVPSRGEGTLPVVRPGEEYNCIATNRHGYLLTCRDGDDAPRVALLMFSDAWGHATAKSWTHHAPMVDNTVVVKSTLPLLPADLPLHKGERHPVVKVGGEDYTVRYSFRDFAVDTTLAKADVEFEPPPPPEAKAPEKTAAEGTRPTDGPAQDNAAAAPQPGQPAAVDIVPLDPLDEPPPPAMGAPDEAAPAKPMPVAPADPLDEPPPPPLNAPDEAAPAKPAPIAPAKPIPVKPTPAKPAPAVVAAVEPAPVDPANPLDEPPPPPLTVAPAAPAPKPVPAEAPPVAPAKPAPVEPAKPAPPAEDKPLPADEKPVEPAKPEPAPVQAPEPVAAPKPEPVAEPKPDAEKPVEVALVQPEPPDKAAPAKPEAAAAAPEALPPTQEEIPAEVIVPLNQLGRITIEWWGDKAKPTIGDDGLLHIELEPGKHQKTFVTILLGKAHQLFLGDLFSFDIDNSDGAVNQAALALMPRGQYYESMSIPLKAGPQNVVLDLADETFKCEKTEWKNTTTLPLPALASRLTIVVYTRKAGEIILSNVRFAAPEPPAVEE